MKFPAFSHRSGKLPPTRHVRRSLPAQPPSRGFSRSLRNGHGRRELLWFEVTRHPRAEWLARQITEAFPWNSAPACLVRDNDRAYGYVFASRVRAMGIRDRPISPRSPWQNGIAERFIGTLRRESLDLVVIFSEMHRRRILSAYAAHSSADALNVTERCAVTSSSLTPWSHPCHSDPGWTTPPICPDNFRTRQDYASSKLSRHSEAT